MIGRRARPGAAAHRTVGRHARQVAVATALLTMLVYLVGCAVTDLVVRSHLYSNVDGRLVARLRTLANEPDIEKSIGVEGLPAGTLAPTPADLDEAPILVWYATPGSAPRPLSASTPAMPPGDLALHQPTTVVVAGRKLRLDAQRVDGATIAVASSTSALSSLLTTLLVAEVILAPIVALAIFLAALLIGVRAAAPVEAARRRQLDFTADASHELRTPLSVIEAEVSLALSASRNATSYHDTLERVAGESKRLRRIVEDLLWLARLDALPAGPVPTEVELTTLAEQVVARFGAIAAQRGLTLRSCAPLAQPVLVLAPADWIERLIGVLVDNACRYCRRGDCIEVTVTASGGEAILLVDDDGPGFAEPTEERLLERFHRASTVAGGSGLGLAIANAVQGATKGTITLSTSPVGGARVRATWPLSLYERGGIARLAHPSGRHGAGGRAHTPSAP